MLSLCPTLATPWTVAHSLLCPFPRQECWSGLPFPSPGISQTQESNPHLLHWQSISLPLGYLESSFLLVIVHINFLFFSIFYFFYFLFFSGILIIETFLSFSTYFEKWLPLLSIIRFNSYLIFNFFDSFTLFIFF